ncbi:hypothetical protein [Prevotella sp. 10(H)]|uniref:hypothetical protein n=1 Tax=Prevotella sp. 10(H) TaxID=1158294 RepID=UPI0004A6E7DB|nr:hypothetical protein [Prevotella sp. 10(H)]
MNKIWLVCILSILFGLVSCSKDNDEEEKEEEYEYEIEETDIVGKWVTTSGKYNLTLLITASDYDFTISEPGKGGSYDRGTYDIANTGKITFTNTSKTILAMGYLRNGKLTLSFVNSIALIMLGTAAGNIEFTLSEDVVEPPVEEGEGALIIQNLSDNYDIVKLDLYDGDGEHLGSDTDVLEPGYQFTYDVEAGSYVAKVTDSRGKSYTSKTLKVVKDKVTVLAYNGSALNILATGIDESQLSKAAINNTAVKYIRFELPLQPIERK